MPDPLFIRKIISKTREDGDLFLWTVEYNEKEDLLAMSQKINDQEQHIYRVSPKLLDPGRIQVDSSDGGAQQLNIPCVYDHLGAEIVWRKTDGTSSTQVSDFFFLLYSRKTKLDPIVTDLKTFLHAHGAKAPTIKTNPATSKIGELLEPAQELNMFPLLNGGYRFRQTVHWNSNSCELQVEHTRLFCQSKNTHKSYLFTFKVRRITCGPEKELFTVDIPCQARCTPPPEAGPEEPAGSISIRFPDESSANALVQYLKDTLETIRAQFVTDHLTLTS